MKAISTLLLCLGVAFRPLDAFTVQPRTASVRSSAKTYVVSSDVSTQRGVGALTHMHRPPSTLNAITADLDTVALVAGQENYGFAIVALGEAIWSFAQAPSFSHAKVLVPAILAAGILGAVSGPMITSGDAGSVQLGLEIATGVAALLGASYVARLVAPYSPSPKEAVFAGLFIAIAGFFSFSQNLIVDGFVTLPSLPSLPLPEMPLGLGEDIDTSI